MPQSEDTDSAFSNRRTILRTSRQIFQEASKVLFEESVFSYCLRRLSYRVYMHPNPCFVDQSLHRIRHLELIEDTNAGNLGWQGSHQLIETLRYFQRRGCAPTSLRLDFSNENSLFLTSSKVLALKLQDAICALWPSDNFTYVTLSPQSPLSCQYSLRKLSL